MPVVYELFVLWSLPFLLLMAAECVFIFWCVSSRRLWPGLMSLLIVIGVLQFFGNVPTLVYIWNNPGWTLIGVGIWIAASAPWAIIKWTLFVRDNSYRYEEILAKFMLDKPEWPKDPNQFTPEQKVEWAEFFHRNKYNTNDYEYERVKFDPSYQEHKSDIMVWMVFWPWSLLWTILNDPLYKLFQNLYRAISAWLQRITDYYWQSKRGHMPTQDEIKQVQDARRNAEMEAHRRAQERQNN